MRLQNKVAIITGAARGIGLSAARRFAQEGARVMLVDVRDEVGRQAAADLRGEGLDVHFRTCDVTSSAQIAETLADTEARFGVPTILVNNAAIHRSIPFLEMTEEQFDEVIGCNLNSVFLFSQAFARRLVAAGLPGSIVNVSSINARMSSAVATAYAASKGGVSAFTASVSLALADHGIRVNAIAPGTIATELSTVVKGHPDALTNTLSRIPMRRVGEPDEIAAAALFLASDDASYMTGQTIFVDGGRTALSIVMPARTTG